MPDYSDDPEGAAEEHEACPAKFAELEAQVRAMKPVVAASLRRYRAQKAILAFWDSDPVNTLPTSLGQEATNARIAEGEALDAYERQIDAHP